MSIADKLSAALGGKEDFGPLVDAVRAAESLVADLGDQIGAQRVKVSELDEKMAHIALQGQGAVFDTAFAAKQTAEKELARLQAASRAATALVGAARLDLHRATVAGNLKTQQRLTNRRQKHAEALAAALAEASKSFRGLVETSELIFTSFPGGAPRGGALTNAAEINRLVATELYRITASRGKSAFPGAKSPDFTNAGQPEKIPPLVGEIARANEFLIRTLNNGPVAPSEPVEEWEIPVETNNG